MASFSAHAVEQLENRTLLNAADLDSTFGVGGIATTELTANGYSGGHVSAVQADGKVVVAGLVIGTNPSQEVFVARYTITGSLDSTFGSGGKELIPLNGVPNIYSMALQPDGRIVLAGSLAASAYTNTADSLVMRLTASGALDSTFNTTGIKVTALSSSGEDEYRTALIRPDGEILLAADVAGGSLYSIAFTLLKANGTPDTTFGANGTVYSTPSNAFVGESLSTAIFDSSGRILIAGYAADSRLGGTILRRYTAQGAADTTFGTNGISHIGEFSADRLLLLSSGKIIVAGSGGLSNNYWLVGRVSSTGSVDTTFGSNGFATAEGSTTSLLATAGMIGNGDIVLVGGVSVPYSGTQSAVAEFTANGVLDTSFTSSGQARPDLSLSVSDAVFYSNGSMDLVGGSSAGATIDRMAPAGALDSSFGTSGTLAFNFSTHVGATTKAQAIQPDGKILEAGMYYIQPYAYIAGFVTRFNADGTPDQTFGSQGVQLLAISPYFEADSIAVQSDGKILVAGTQGANYYTPQVVIAERLNKDGSFDTSFGTNGQVTVTQQYASLGNYQATAIQVQSDGRIDVLAETPSGSNQSVLARLTPAGAWDQSFGTYGGYSTFYARYSTMTLDSAGRFLLAGGTSVTRLSALGAPDPTFAAGAMSTDVTAGVGNGAVAVGVDQKILVAGVVGSAAAVERYNANGTRDMSFGVGGISQLTTANSTFNALAVLSAGTIVAVGTAGSNLGLSVEFDQAGALLPAFGNGGVATSSFNAVSATIGGVNLAPNGNLIVGGVAGHSVLAARLIGTTPDSIAGSANSDTVVLTRQTNGLTIAWTYGNESGVLPAADPAGLTINGNGGSDTITLVGSNALPNTVHLNGTFTINGLTGSNPLANTNLDIGSGPIYIGYASQALDPISDMRGYLKNGYASGTWNGAATSVTGVITSGKAAADTTHTTGIGYADSADGLVPLPANTIELKYTLYGDTGLAGSVSFPDFMRMTQHYTITSGATWGEGDFNYDGVVGQADFGLLQPNYGVTLPVQSAVPAVVDPTPTRPTRTVTLPPPAQSLTALNSVSLLTLAASDRVSKKHTAAKVKHKK